MPDPHPPGEPPADPTKPARTYHHSAWTVDELVAAKHARQRTVSVVLPAKNEEATVGRIADHLRRTLVVDRPLVDEILVVDGGSTDATVEVAEAAGVAVRSQAGILPEAGDHPGKGEALWKGLAATRGDLVVFVDTDIVDADDRFVTGLLGPLLTHEGIRFVKAAYDRPLRRDGELRPGGGRVTELMARPLLATFWPELAWLAQPLSGEYAGDRELLESVPFVHGYGVELALLIDIAAAYGPEVIAQVDLDRRVHTNQPIDALGRMAAEILHVAMGRLGEAGRLLLPDAPATALPQPVRDAQDRLRMRTSRIDPSQRPPLATWRQDRHR